MTEAQARKLAGGLTLPRSWTQEIVAYAVDCTESVAVIGGREIGSAIATRAALLRGVVRDTVDAAAAACVLAVLADSRQSVAPVGTDDSVALAYGGMPEVYPATAAAAGRIVFNPETGSRIRVGSVKVCNDRIVVFGDDLDGPKLLGPFKMELDPTLRLVLASGVGPNPFADGRRRSQLWKIRSGQNGAAAYAAEEARKKRAREKAGTRARRRTMAQLFGSPSGGPEDKWDPLLSIADQRAAVAKYSSPAPYPGDDRPTKNGWPVSPWGGSYAKP